VRTEAGDLQKAMQAIGSVPKTAVVPAQKKTPARKKRPAK
jgi:hypothetical protein